MNKFPDEETNFGFSTVNITKKQGLINEIFSNVVSSYDLMNDLMSGGIHRLWKNNFCQMIPNLSSDILDIAGGTGDIAMRLKKIAKSQQANPVITICDINFDMLSRGRDKLIDHGMLNAFSYVCGNSEQLPFKDNSFDYVTIAFGIRNFTQINQALKEAYRVLRPLGKFLCLEFSKPQIPLVKGIYNFYSFTVIPKIGKFVAGNENAYKYLVESIANFPSQDEFAILIKQAGFEKVSYQNLSNGIAAIHLGYKL